MWLVISLGSLIDLQFGDRLYYPTSALDNSVRTAFVQSISTTGIPPQNPFFQPAQPVSLRYHYFWLMMCSLVERAGNHGIAPRQALTAGPFWCGVGLMALVALYLRLFTPQRSGALPAPGPHEPSSAYVHHRVGHPSHDISVDPLRQGRARLLSYPASSGGTNMWTGSSTLHSGPHMR